MTTTTEKLKALEAANADFEWYPTTDEIIGAMTKDIRSLFKKETIGSGRDSDYFISGNDKKSFRVKTFLDIGAGDGRIFAQFKNLADMDIEDCYGVEIAKPFADDLIAQGIFLIGRDFFRTSLIDKKYAVIFSNPPYSKYVPWTVRLLQEANFGIMYLVLPVRWEANKEITHRMERYHIKTLGEYDFLAGDRPARARVNLIRLMIPRRKIEGRYYEEKEEDADSFDRWIFEHIGTFQPEGPEEEAEEETNLKIRNTEIGEMVESYEYEMNSLLQAFQSLAKIPPRIIRDLELDQRKILDRIKNNIENLKNKYWKMAFTKLYAINSRLTRNTRREMLGRMSEFKTLDFNEENVYSVVIWVIHNFNKYTAQQILEVFDALTSPDYIKAYKSNVHWTKDDWRYAKGSGKPDKYILDYRLVTRCYVPKWGDPDSIIDDLKIICESLGYKIPEWERPHYTQDGSRQTFTTWDQEIAFTARLYLNNNLHLKINEKIMLRFNIEVARLRHWINGPEDIEREYEVPPEEAIRLWREPGLIKIGQSDILQLGFNPNMGEGA